MLLRRLVNSGHPAPRSATSHASACVPRQASVARPVASQGRQELAPRASAGGSGLEPSQQAVDDAIIVPMRLADLGRLRFGRFQGCKKGMQGWHKLFPSQAKLAAQAYESKGAQQYPMVDVWLRDGLSGWAPVQLRLVHDSRGCYVLKCLRSDADALGLEVGDSLALLALRLASDSVIALAACTPSGELKAGGALGGAGGAAAGVRAAAAAAAAARASTPPPPAFTAAYSISQQQQAGGSSEVLLEVTLPSLTDMGAGGSGAAGVQEPADQQRMTLLLVQVQPHHDPHSLRPKAHDMQSTPCLVTWQRQAGGDGAGFADGALLRGLPAALLPELPPQGRLLVLPAQSLAVLVAAPTQATTALAAVGAPAVAAKPQPPEVPTAAATSSSAASSSTASSSALASGHSTTRARPAATLPPLASPPLLALFTVGGPVEGADAGGLLQLVAEKPLQWETLVQAWGLAHDCMTQQQRRQQRQAVEVCLPQLVPSTAAASGEPSFAVRWPRVPMWLLAAGPDARGAGDDSSGPVLCCRSEALHVLGLQPGDRLALHPEGPGRVILVVPPSRGNATAAHTVAGGGGIGAPAAAAPPGPEPLLLTWNKELRVKVNLHEGRSDWIPLFPTETPLARGDGGRQPVPQEVVLWAPPQLAPVPAAARNPHAPVPLHFGLALNNPGRRGKYMMSTYRSRISGRMSQAPDGSVMAVMPGSRLVVAWWWPPAHNPAASVEGGSAE